MDAESRLHLSDCALHNAPAYEPGPCDCGAMDYPWRDFTISPHDRMELFIKCVANNAFASVREDGERLEAHILCRAMDDHEAA